VEADEKMDSGEQVRAALRQFHERAAVMHFEPAALNRQVEAGPIFRRRSFVAKQERAVEFLDIDAAILHRLEGVRVLHQTARSFVGIAIEAVGGVFHQFLMQPRPRCYRAFMCSDRPNAVQRKMVAWRRWLVPRPLKSVSTEVYLTDVTPQKIDLDQF